MEAKNPASLPKHIGIIMDGNGRWAKKRRFPRVFGHQSAISNVREIVSSCAELGIETLTLYAFSTENWSRPKLEVNTLMKLFEQFLESELSTMIDNDIRLRVLGEQNDLPKSVLKPLNIALEKTKNNRGMVLCLAVNYGSRDEITRACRKIAEQVQRGELEPEAIDEKLISDSLYTEGLHDPDLIIRTSGEERLSNFLLWQAAYAEFYFTKILWPDFTKKDLMKALDAYTRRVRRLGNIDVEE